MEPERLSDIHVEVDGFTADDVIANRKAQRQEIERLRTSANPRMREMYGQFREMELLGQRMGVDADYDEQMDDSDMY